MNLIKEEKEDLYGDSYKEALIRQVEGTMAIAGMTLSDEDKQRIRDFAFDPEEIEQAIEKLVIKHRVEDNNQMSVEEMSRLTLEHYRKIGREPLTLDEINQYIKEVREGKGEKEDEAATV